LRHDEKDRSRTLKDMRQVLLVDANPDRRVSGCDVGLEAVIGSATNRKEQ
jgi:hypothetical protein